MKQADLHFFRTFLVTQKSSILNKTAEFKSQQRQGQERMTDDAELASADLSLNLSLHELERQRTMLLQIEKALSKITDGSYGQCESCDASIGVPRLTAKPFATLCIECMEDQEDKKNRLH